MSFELQPGEHCGDYELLAYIGQGGMAQVWSARSLLNGELVAVKTLLPAYAENSVLKERLSREGQSQNILHHPNILHSRGTYQWNGSVFMVMDLVDGESLEKYILRRRIMPVPEVRGVAQAVLSALSHAHANSIVHRDVKPSNILLSRRGRILLGDFGIALLQNSIRLTRFGGMGTPCYMSPEQIVGRDIDHRSDIYSVACVLYELLTGFPPFHAEGSDANEKVRAAHQDRAPEPLIPRNPAVPVALEKAVLRALGKKKERRFESCAAFAAALGVSLQVRPADDSRAAEPPADIPSTPSHPAIVFPRGYAQAAAASVAARSTPSLEIPRAATPAGTPKDAGSRVQGPISGPGVTMIGASMLGPNMLGPTITRHSPTPAPEASARRSSLALLIRRPEVIGLIAIVAAALVLVLAISRGRNKAPTAPQGPQVTVSTPPALSPAASESSRAAGQSGVAPNAAASRPPAPTDELPASDSNSGPKAPDQSGQTVADGIQSETSTAGTTGNTTGNTADNTAGNSTRNRPAPLSPPPVSANKGK